MFQFDGADFLSLAQSNGSLLQISLCHHLHGHCLGEGDHNVRRCNLPARESAEGIRAHNLIAGVALGIFHGTAIGRRQKADPFRPEQLFQILKAVTGLVFIIHDDEHRTACTIGAITLFVGCQKHRSG